MPTTTVKQLPDGRTVLYVSDDSTTGSTAYPALTLVSQTASWGSYELEVWEPAVPQPTFASSQAPRTARLAALPRGFPGPGAARRPGYRRR